MKLLTKTLFTREDFLDKREYEISCEDQGKLVHYFQTKRVSYLTRYSR